MMTVSALNTKIRSLLEVTFAYVMVEGEVASVTYHRSGHVYFSIKDEKSSIRCVMWRSTAKRMKFRLEENEHIVIDGSISVYVPRGDYQLIATHIEPYGKGTLAVAFEQLKKDLQTKGYFDPEHKKPLPPYPHRIALVTAAGGAALQDMLKVAQKRWKQTEFIVIDVLVQGIEAAAQIATAIKYADTLGVDIIVIGRGGGSMDDLWAFNELPVAEAIFASHTPVVSAVGHEVDNMISDFVADLRAPTPSAAMEMILPDANELFQMLDERTDRIEIVIKSIINKKSEQLFTLRDHYSQRSPSYHMKHLSERFASLQKDFEYTIKYKLDQFAYIVDPMHDRLNNGISFVTRHKSSQLQVLHERLLLLDPAKRTREGFVEVTKDGKRIGLKDIEVGDKFDVVSSKYIISVKSLEKRKL